ncbi:MAG TPA: hypothetical protein VNG53_09515 [Bacteroidia bacterium]|nr:hypothetical protein [Bacteroidia bacterium]
MLTKEFNALPLDQKSKLVFIEGKLIGISKEHPVLKCFFYKLNDLKIDVIYDKALNQLLDVIAWENSEDRLAFLR